MAAQRSRSPSRRAREPDARDAFAADARFRGRSWLLVMSWRRSRRRCSSPGATTPLHALIRLAICGARRHWLSALVVTEDDGSRHADATTIVSLGNALNNAPHTLRPRSFR